MRDLVFIVVLPEQIELMMNGLDFTSQSVLDGRREMGGKKAEASMLRPETGRALAKCNVNGSPLESPDFFLPVPGQPMTTTRLALGFILLAAALPLSAQTPAGAEIFNSFCASCHTAEGADKIPSAGKLRELNANAILRTLTDGAMRIQGSTISAEQRTAVAEYLAGGPVIEQPLSFSVGM